MVKMENRIIVRRPIEQVFAFVGELENQTQWDPELLQMRRTSEGPLGIGTKYTAVRKLMGQETQADIEFVSYEPNRRLTYKSNSGSVPWQTMHDFESTAEGTRLTTTIELYPKGFMSLAQPFLASTLRRQMQTQFCDLEDLLNSPAASH